MNRSEIYELIDGKVLVTTSSGWTVECLPVADRMMQSGMRIPEPPEPEPPTYTIKGVADVEQQMPHDETTIEDPKTTPDEKEAWEKYLVVYRSYEEEMATVEDKRNEMKMMFIAERAIKVHDLPDNLEEWATIQRERYGFDISIDPDDLLREFVGGEVIRTKEDANRVVVGIFKATGLDQEVQATIEDSFRDSMGISTGEDTQADTEDAAQVQREEETGVVDGGNVDDTRRDGEV